jgi:hypothetical protein
MSFAPVPTPEEIEAKINELREKIAIGKQAEQDLDKLEKNLVAIAELIKAAGPPQETFAPPTGLKFTVASYRPKREFSPLANMAEAVIHRYGARHINDLMENMKSIGWESSGDHNLDYKNVYNCLAVNKKFTNLGKNIWDLTENVKKGEVSK